MLIDDGVIIVVVVGMSFLSTCTGFAVGAFAVRADSVGEVLGERSQDGCSQKPRLGTYIPFFKQSRREEVVVLVP